MGKAHAIATVLLISLSFLFLFGCTAPSSELSPQGQNSTSSAGVLDSLNTQVPIGVAKDAKYYTQLGFERFNLGDNSGALEYYAKAIALDKNYAPAYFARGQLKRTSSDSFGAYDDFKAAIAADPEYPEAQAAACNILVEFGNYNLSLANCKAALDLGLDAPQVHNDYAVALFKLGDINASLSEFTAALESGGTQAMVYRSRAIARDKLGDYAGAISDIEEYLKQVPDDNSARLYLEQIQGRLGVPADSGNADETIKENETENVISS